MVLKKRARISYELFLEISDILELFKQKGITLSDSRVRINDVAIINDEVMIVVDCTDPSIQTVG